MPSQTQTVKDPNYFKKYYQNNKDKAKLTKSKSYAIQRCGLAPDIAVKFGSNANLAGRFQKIYLQIKNDCPDVLDFMLEYLGNNMIVEYNENEEDE